MHSIFVVAVIMKQEVIKDKLSINNKEQIKIKKIKKFLTYI
jgi:hypothetical protein